MKFRRLSTEELEILKDDFVKFLAANTVTASDWINIKANKPQETFELIDMFSDIVMEKVYSKVEYLENRSKEALLLFKFEGDLMMILGVNVEGQNIDFENIDLENINFDQVKLTGFRSSKVLDKEVKAQEIHNLIESGCFMGNAERFQLLDQIIE